MSKRKRKPLPPPRVQYDPVDDGVPLHRVPTSVFYTGRRANRHTDSFRPTHETQAMIERARRRKAQ